MKQDIFSGTHALAVRSKLGINQSKFWGAVQVTQSGGSRYESGRDIPAPVQLLLAMRYGTAAQRRRALKLMGVESIIP